MKTISFLLLLFPILSFSQNLVPNPSFEDTVHCPTFASQIYNAQFWYEPSIGTPDYYNSCSASPYCTSPGNVAGYQMPRTGNAYAGMAVLSAKEYIGCKLIDSLKRNHIYAGNFYVSLADSFQFACSSLGMYFSKDSVYDSTFRNLPYTPQIENPDSNIIKDKINWVFISGEFKAEGQERYLVIGNFRPDSTSNYKFVGGSNSYPLGYYFIDDVSVIDLGLSGINNVNTIEGVSVFPNPTTGILNIHFANNLNGHLGIFDVLGRLIYSEDFINKNFLQKDVSTVTSGIYFLKISIGLKQFIQKVVINN